MARTQKLVSRRNSNRVRDLVIFAAEKTFRTAGTSTKVREVAFRRGRWEVIIWAPDADYVYEVVDAEPGRAGTGLDFRKL